MNNLQEIATRIQSIRERFENLPLPTNYKQASNRTNDKKQQFASILDTKIYPGKQENLDKGSIESIVREFAGKYQVPPSLALAIAKTESNFDPRVTSCAGAGGVMQLMPATAQELGVKNVYDPHDNIDGGVRYIKQLLGHFDGNMEKAVAAYNAGMGAVEQYNGIPPYAETQEYVSKVLTRMQD